MTNYISVCKNIIQSNNKNNWVDPQPAIRISKSKSGKAINRGHTLAIKDKDGNIVARILSSKDGKPIIKAGAKVVIETLYEVEILD